jgi:hypothetical protein
VQISGSEACSHSPEASEKAHEQDLDFCQIASEALSQRVL